MNPTIRPGVFQAFVHDVPDDRWWLVLDGTYATRSGMAGHTIEFATCGAPCWPTNPDPHFTRCPKCFPDQPKNFSNTLGSCDQASWDT
jgi:hypothetical protein